MPTNVFCQNHNPTNGQHVGAEHTDQVQFRKITTIFNNQNLENDWECLVLAIILKVWNQARALSLKCKVSGAQTQGSGS